MTTKVTSRDISEVARQLYSQEELTKMSKERLTTLVVLIRNNLKAGRVFGSKELEQLKRRFTTNHSHPALERLLAASRSSATQP